MKLRTKNLLSTFGATSLILGLAALIPAYSNNNYLGFGISIAFVIIGGILLSLAFGE